MGEPQLPVTDSTPSPTDNAALIARLKGEHGDNLFELDAGDDTTRVIARVASRVEWKRFMDESSDDRKRASALEKIGRACIVYPDAQALDEIIADQPGLPFSWGAKVAEVSGLVRDVSVKKL